MMKKTCKAILSAVLSLVLVAIMIAVIPSLMSTEAYAEEAEISIRCESEEVAYGETVKLTADMSSELTTCTWVWEAGNGETWTVVQEGGMSYEFVADSSNTQMEYRVVVMGA